MSTTKDQTMTGRLESRFTNQQLATEEYEYTSTGEPVLPLRLTEHSDWDALESDLEFNRARHFDPTVGRWLGENPLGCVGGKTKVSGPLKTVPLRLMMGQTSHRKAFSNPKNFHPVFSNPKKRHEGHCKWRVSHRERHEAQKVDIHLFQKR